MIFRNWVLENFPFLEDDFDALTDYELFCKMMEYVKQFAKDNEEFKKQIKDLENYVYNLDLQDEVDKKLDEMAESGQLTDIIAQYLQLAGVLAFNTVSEMKAATNLANGSICKTLGFSNYNDGNGYYYKVRTVTNSDDIDEFNIIALTDENLVAEMIYPNKLFIFDTVQNMKSSKLLKGRCICYGYYEKDDNIPVTYEIKDSGTANDGNIVALASGKLAHAILNFGVTPETFGIKEGLTETENKTRWSNYVSYVNTNQNVYFELMAKTYTIYSPIVVGCEFKGQGEGRTILKAHTNIGSKTITLEDTSHTEHTETHTCVIYLSNYDVLNNNLVVHDFTIDCDGKSECGIFQGNGALYDVHDIDIYNSTVDGIRIVTGWQNSYRNIVIDITQGTGFEFGDATYDTASGTTLNLENIHVQGHNTAYAGYVIYQLYYSTFNNVSCDNVLNGYAYYFNKCDNISGNIGCEYITTNKSCLHIENSEVDFNLSTYMITINNTLGYSDIIELLGTTSAKINLHYKDTTWNIGGITQIYADSNVYYELMFNNLDFPSNAIFQGTVGTHFTGILKMPNGFYYANDSFSLTQLQ